MANGKSGAGKKVLIIIGFIIMIACFFVQPFPGLEPVGMRFLGIFIWWIILMVTEPIPTYLACMAGLVVSIAAGCTTFEEAFSSFASSTSILLIGAFGLATALTNSGLLNRVALLVMKLFPGTYKGQVLAVSIASFVISPTIPSTTAKSAVLIPVVNSICDEMGYEPHSKGAVGLISVCNTVTNCCGPMFMTGGIVAAVMLSLYTGSINWGSYLIFALVWGLIVFVGTVFFHLFYYNPDKGVAKDQVKVLGKEVIEQRLKDLGKMNRNEIVALVVLLASIALWITESAHGIPTAVVAIGAWVVLCAFNLFSVADFNSGKMMWTVWALVAAVLGFVDLMTSTGLSAWVGDLVAPVVSIFASSPALVVIACAVLSALLMMALVNYLIFAALALALLSAVPMDPLCILFPICMSGMIFILPPQNVCVLAVEGLAGGRVSFGDLRPAAVQYIVTCIIGCAASIPWWSMLGYIY